MYFSKSELSRFTKILWDFNYILVFYFHSLYLYIVPITLYFIPKALPKTKN